MADDRGRRPSEARQQIVRSKPKAAKRERPNRFAERIFSERQDAYAASDRSLSEVLPAAWRPSGVS
jgi:hypothetical protein